MSQDPFAQHFWANDAQESQEIQPTPVEPRQILDQVISEITELEGRLAALYKVRENLQGTVQRPQGVRSPVQTLPEDIVREIFVHCLPEVRLPTLHIADAPLLLTIICRRWRDVALNERRLWTRLHIVAEPEEYTPQGGASNIPEWQKATNRTAESQLAVIKSYISRSGSLPLSISVRDLNPGTTAGAPSPTISYLITLLPRLKRLFWTWSSTLDKLLPGIPADNFRCLESLRFEWVPNSDGGGPLPAFLLAPRLHEVEIYRLAPRAAELPLRWEQLTRLALFNRPPRLPDIPQLVDLLKRCPRLQECRVAMVGEPTRPRCCESLDPSATSRFFTSQPLVLQHLRKLEITHDECIGGWGEYITFPALADLALLGASYERGLRGCCACLPSLIRPNANTLTSMEHLTIRVGYYTPRSLVGCLSQLPRLRSLVLEDYGMTQHYKGEDKTDDSPWFDERILTRMTPQISTHRSSMHSAANKTAGGEDPQISLRNPNCLCPLLERFGFLEREGFMENRHLTLKAIVPFVSGKWEASQKYPGVFAPLKHLKVPSRALPDGRVKHALKRWREQAGLVVEIAYPALDPFRVWNSRQYQGVSGPNLAHHMTY